MALMHNNALRVNAQAPDDAEQMAVYHETGWRAGPHKDSDPDDPSPIPRVLEPAAEDDEDEEPAKTTRASKATSKEK